MSDVELTIGARADAALKEVAGFRKEFAKLVKDAEKPIRQVNTFRELETTLEQTSRKIRETRDRIRDLGTAMAGVEQPTKEVTAEYRQAIKELKILERQEQSQIGRLGALRRQLQAAGIDTSNLVAEQQRLARALDSAVSSAKSGQAAVLRQEAEAAAVAAREQEKLAAQRALGVGSLERTQRQLVELRQQYRLITSDSTLSAKQRAEAEANYRSSVASTLAELRGLRAGLSESGQAMQRAGLSAGQYRQAMQQLPMQLTDVVTSLASGMPLWMVAIQQGGQIRDSFGGIGNAAKAVASALSPLAVAISAAAAGAGALLLAYQQGSQEAVAYNRALILTGNAAGTSADQLAGMALRMDAVSGTQRQAAAALAEIAGTGKFAATQIEAIGTAAVAMENATGRAVSDIVAEFARLAEEPAAASAKLNQQYNYLTAAVYKQIRALEQQGDAQGAAQLAIDTYAEALRERAAQIAENLGYLERAWRAVGGAAAESWDAMLGIGRADTLEEKLAGAYQELERLQKFTRNAVGGIGERRLKGALEEVERLQQLIQERDAKALEQSQLAAVSEAGIEAAQKLDSALVSTASNAEKLKARLKEIDDQAAAAAKAGIAYSEEKLEQLRGAAREQYADQKTAAESYAENLRRQIELHGDASEAAKVRYAIERGELGELTEAQKQALIADAEMLDAIEEHQKKRSAVERKATSDLEAALKAQLETRQRYAKALAGLQGGGEASYGAAQALKLKAQQALANKDVEGAKLNAQAALKMLQELAQAGENTFGFEGFIKSLQQIEESADQINVDKAKKALDEVKQKGADLKALLDSVKSTTITVKMDDAALAKARQDIIDLAKLAGKPVELPAAVARQDGPAPASPGASKPSAPPALQGGSTRLAPAVGGKPVVEADIVPTGIRQDGPASFTNLPPVEVDVLPTGVRQDGTSSFTNLPPVAVDILPKGIRQDGENSFTNLPAVEVDVLPKGIRQDGENSFTNLPPVDVLLEVDQEAAAQAQQQIDALAQRFRRQLVIPVAPTVAPVSGDAAPGFASGGYTGPGGKWQPAGVVHAGEHVQPQEVVREPGALAFLERIRRNGYQATMQQLSRTLRGYASGGPVIPVGRALPNIPSLSPELAAAAAGPSFPDLGRVEFVSGGDSVTLYGDQQAAFDLRRLAMKFSRTHRR